MNDTEQEELHGTCVFFSETGTEGGYWAFQDSQHPDSYDGLHILKKGDQLIIYDKDDPQRVAWKGTVSLIPRTSLEENVFGWRIHSRPQNADLEEWARLFFHGYPAMLVLK